MYINKHKKGFLTLFRVLLVCYVLALVYFLFLCEAFGRTGVQHSTYQYNLILFHEIRRFIMYQDQVGKMRSFLNLYGNILIFVPFGFVSPILVRKLRGFFRITLVCLGISVTVEVVQLLTRTGSFDVDDILLNTVGGMLGFMLYYVIQHHRDIQADLWREKMRKSE